MATFIAKRIQKSNKSPQIVFIIAAGILLSTGDVCKSEQQNIYLTKSTNKYKESLGLMQTLTLNH